MSSDRAATLRVTQRAALIEHPLLGGGHADHGDLVLVLGLLKPAVRDALGETGGHVGVHAASGTRVSLAGAPGV
jgi:hypothetical protein